MPYDILEDTAPKAQGYEILDEKPAQVRGYEILDDQPAARDAGLKAAVGDVLTRGRANPVTDTRKPIISGESDEWAGAGYALRRGLLSAQAILPNLMLPEVQRNVEREEGAASIGLPADPMRSTLQGVRMNPARESSKLINRTEADRTSAVEAAKSIREVWSSVAADFQKEIRGVPNSQAQAELAATYSQGDKWSVFKKYPVQVVSSIALESLIPSIAGAVIGAQAGPAGMVVGVGAASAAQEFSAELLNGAAQAGFDVKDEKQLEAFLDSAAFDGAFNKALTRATIIGGVDAGTMGAAGMFMKPALKLGLRKILVATGKESLLQVFGGAGGEFLAQTATKGHESYDWFDVAMEAAAELATGPGEVFSNVRSASASQSGKPVYQMTPDEFDAYKSASDSVALKQKQDEARARGEDSSNVVLTSANERGALAAALKNGRPVNAALLERYNASANRILPIPEGWERRGEMWHPPDEAGSETSQNGKSELPAVSQSGNASSKPDATTAKAAEYQYASPESKAWWETLDELQAKLDALQKDPNTEGSPERSAARKALNDHGDLQYTPEGRAAGLSARRISKSNPLKEVNSTSNQYDTIGQGDLTGFKFLGDWIAAEDGRIFRRVVSPDGKTTLLVWKETLHPLEEAALDKNTKTATAADTSAQALKELQEAMRGNQGRKPFAQAPTAPAPVAGAPAPAALTEEQRAAIEFQRKTDEAVKAALANPDKNYETMSRDEVELLAGMGDAKAIVERKARDKAAVIKFTNLIQDMPGSADVALPAVEVPGTLPVERTDLVAEMRAADAKRGQPMDFVTRDEGEWSVQDAVKENGGISAPPLDDALGRMNAGESPGKIVNAWTGGRGGAEALVDILEQLNEAQKKGRNRPQFRDLVAAYEKAFYQEGRNKTDKTLDAIERQVRTGRKPRGGVPADTNELIARQWDEVRGGGTVELNAAESAFYLADVASKRTGRNAAQDGGVGVAMDALQPGDQFNLDGVGFEVTRSTGDGVYLAETGEGRSTGKFGRAPLLRHDLLNRIYPDAGTYTRAVDRVDAGGAQGQSAPNASPGDHEAGTTTQERAATEALNQSLSAQGWRVRLRARTSPVSDAARSNDERRTVGEGIRALERILRRRVVFVEGVGGQPLFFNGAINSRIPGVVFINARANIGPISVLGHEFIESLEIEDPALYARLRNELVPLLKDFANYKARLQMLSDPAAQQAGRRGNPVTDEDALRDLIADFMGDALAKPAFLQRLQARNPSLFREVTGALLRFIRKVKGLLARYERGKFFKDIEQAEERLIDMLEEYAQGREGEDAVSAGDLVDMETYIDDGGTTVSPGDPGAGGVAEDNIPFSLADTNREINELRRREDTQGLDIFKTQRLRELERQLGQEDLLATEARPAEDVAEEQRKKAQAAKIAQKQGKRLVAGAIENQDDMFAAPPEQGSFFSLAEEDFTPAFNSAAKQFGVTDDIMEAGYVLPDGRMLDFSGRSQMEDSYEFKNGRWVPKSGNRDYQRGVRHVDHREIEWEGKPRFAENWGAMVEFMKRGAVRIDAASGAISVHGRNPLTRAQESRVRQIVEINEGQVWLDAEDDSGKRMHQTYDVSNAKRVLGNLKRWSRGEEPESGTRFSLGDQQEFPAGFNDGELPLLNRAPLPDQTFPGDDAGRRQSAGDADAGGQAGALSARAIPAETSGTIAEGIRGKIIALDQEIAKLHANIERHGEKTATHLRLTSQARYLEGQRDALAKVWENFKDSPETRAGEVFFSLGEDDKPAAFHSRLNRTVEQSPQGKASGAQWKATIRNSKLGANADEMALANVADLEDGKTYTKTEVLEYLRANEVVVKDVTLGAPRDWSAGFEVRETTDPHFRFGIFRLDNGEQVNGTSTREDAEMMVARPEDYALDLGLNQPNSTHFSTWQLPGGKEGSYREVLLTVPRRELSELEVQEMAKLRTQKQLSKQELDRLSFLNGRVLGGVHDQSQWSDGHSEYSSIANPIVRLRFNERTTVGGQRMLFLEEVQAPQPGQFDKMPKLFQDKWRDIGFKWALRHAAENGFDAVGWTTGEQQAERYDLSKQVRSITYTRHTDGTYDLTVEPLSAAPAGWENTGPAFDRNVATRAAADKLEGIVGKEIAKQIQESPRNIGTIEGEGLKVGGVGLTQLYDSDFRNVVNGLPAVKRSGQKVGTAEIIAGDERIFSGNTALRDINATLDTIRAEWSGPRRTAAGWGRWSARLDAQATDVTDAMQAGQPYAEAMRLHGSTALAEELGGVFGTSPITAPVHSLTITREIRESVMAGQARFSLAEEPSAAEKKDQKHEAATRAPWAKSAPVVPVDATQSRVDYRLIEPAKNKVNADLIRDYGYVRLRDGATDAEAIEQFIEHVKGNLVWIYNQIPKAIRDRSKLWYSGARKMTERMAVEYRKPPRTVAAVMAVMSPGLDWFQNVSLGIRILEIRTKHWNVRPDDRMRAISRKHEANEKSGFKRYLPDFWRDNADKTAAEMDPFSQAVFLRLYDEAHLPRHHHLITPEGDILARPVTNDDQLTPSATAWANGMLPIQKALSILKDSSLENISVQLGHAHKVRNFYNNILLPSSPDHITIDTHAVGAGLMLPVAQSSEEVLHNFGTGGTSSSAATGMSGLYPYHFEAYRRAAEEVGILPREMQSITWEAIRGLFTDKFKSLRDADDLPVNLGKLRQVWQLYGNGKITLGDARKRAVRLGGGWRPPAWAGRENTAAANSAVGRGSNAADVAGVERGSRGDKPGTLGSGRATLERLDPAALAPRFSLSDDEAEAGRTSLRGQIEALGREMDAVRARGEAIPEPMLEQYKELVDTLGEDIRAGRASSGRGRGGVAVDAGLQASGTPGGTPAQRARRPVGSFKGATRLPRGSLADAWHALNEWRHKLGERWRRRGTDAQLTTQKDAGNNRADLLANQAGGRVRLALNRAFASAAKDVRAKNDLREFALTFAVEADGERARLMEMHEDIGSTEYADTTLGKRALAAIEFANDNWDRFQDAITEYRTLTQIQRESELNGALDSNEWQGGYVYHAWKGFESPAGDATKPAPAATPFRKRRSVPTYAEGIAAGLQPQSLNAIELLSKRVQSGQRKLNELDWLYALRDTTDPVTGDPVATDVEWKPQAPQRGMRNPEGSAEFEEALPAKWVATAPPGYVVSSVGEVQFALKRGFEALLTDLTSPSWWRGGYWRSGVQNVVSTSKHIVLLFDTFHLGRLMFWKTVVTGSPAYRKGLTMLDYSAADVREMARRGEIPQSYVKDLEQNITDMKLLVDAGFNVGQIRDNLWSDWISNIPGIGTFNKWLFGQYQRGAMAEAALLEYRRLSKAMPNASAKVVARQVARDINTRFGSLGNQGWIRSKTGQDLARLTFLAPQWNEGLIRSEVGALVQSARLPFDSVQQRRLVVGTLLKSAGTMMLSQFLANQLINYITRGGPTWDNPEETPGAKFSAYIPDVVGNGAGFMLNPFALAAEYTHLIEGNLHRSEGFADAMNRIAQSRLSGPARAVTMFMTRKDSLGRNLREGEVFPAVAKALIPLPIATGAFGAAARQMITGEPSEQFSGQFQKQAMASVGIKTDQAPNPEQRIRSLAKKFNTAQGIIPNATYYGGDFSEFTEALRRGNQTDAARALVELRQKKTAEQIREHYKRWAAAPFTGQASRETAFRRTLTEEQGGQYDAARAARRALAIKAREVARGQ